MRLFIAEKPSMGMEIAKVLANKNNKLLYKCIDSVHFNRDLVEKSIFPSILKFSKLLENAK